MNLCDIETLRELLERYGFHFSRSMGQNFLIDPEIPRRIAESSGADADCGVLEIGPGVGALTRELSARAGNVLSVELDRNLLPLLGETLGDCQNVELVCGDVLKLDLSDLIREKLSGRRVLVCANLPYNITTPVLTRIMETPSVSGCTVMVQREAAERICARPGKDVCGEFSLLFQYHMSAERLFDVKPESFLPAPKVTSSVVRCVRRTERPVAPENEEFFFRVIRGGFLLRRKTLANSLAAAFPQIDKSVIQRAITACGLSENIRGERLNLEQFAQISHLLQGSKM